LLTFTEQFDNAAWTKTNVAITANSAVAPDGTTTADLFTTPASGANSNVFISTASGLACSVYAKRVNNDWVALSNNSFFAYFNINNGTVGTVGSGTASIADVGNGWWRLQWVPASGAGALRVRNVAADGSGSVNGGEEALFWGAQNEAISVTDYQRVGTAFDVTEAGVASRSYLSFDGTDDGMLTGNIVPGTDKAQVFAGLRKLNDVATAVVAELSTSTAVNNGSLGLYAPGNSAVPTYAFHSRGTSRVLNEPSGFAAPITNVVTGLADISAQSSIVRVDGTQVGSAGASQGTGNYLTYPLYIGRRAGTSLPFNGQIFGLILRFGTNLSAATVTQTETWLANRAAPTVVIP
jgi:hypothetical protein